MSAGDAQTLSVPKVETGIPGLDHVSMGGFPRGRVVVATGTPAVYVTLEETAEDLRRNFATLGFDIASWEESGNWAFVDVSPRYDANLDEVSEIQVNTLLVQIGRALDRTAATRVVIDS